MDGLKKKALFDLKEDEQKVLLYILGDNFAPHILYIITDSLSIDNSNTGNVNQHKFSEFLKGFGPINDCIRNMKSILSCP